ncbi:MAG TPA: FAD-binding oxidoreductase [Candidatus Eisenbacteria bacterium]|nr:FAD-binding oxidoreductase [Candidatus Eisenbacteria bacterium]
MLPADRLERVWSWGGATSAMSWVYRPTTIGGLHEVLALARAEGRTIGLRGAGQSYGDAATNAENLCLDTSRMNRILEWDPASGRIRVEPGVTIGQLWRYTIEDGWWPPVVSGTMFTSLGGAAAMNIHGKNNWKVGTIGEHVEAFELLLPSGEIVRCSREERSDLFHAAIGGFGMLGCFTSLTLRLKRIHSGLLEVEPIPIRSLGEMFDVVEERMDAADYLVGWVDTFGRGRGLGRGLVHHATYLRDGEDPMAAQTLRVASQELPPTLMGVVPKSLMWLAMRPFTNDPGVRLVNATKYGLSALEGRRRYRQSHVGFAFLLDYVPDWKRSYGGGGLIQYQTFLPAATARDVYREILERSHRAGLTPYLGVFKRHRMDPFLMTHAVDGYSLALDFKVTARNRRRLWEHAADLTRVVLDAGGRFYFAKDSTLTASQLETYLAEERVQRFLALKRRLDPEGLLVTDLYRRIFRGPDAMDKEARDGRISP